MKKRSVFMVVALLMLGLNLEAKNLTSTTPVAPSEVKNSSQHSYGIPPQVVIRVPVDIYIPRGVSIKYAAPVPTGTHISFDSSGNPSAPDDSTPMFEFSDEGITTGESNLICILIFSDGTKKSSKKVQLHNGHYTAYVEFKDIPKDKLVRLKSYECYHMIKTNNSTQDTYQILTINHSIFTSSVKPKVEGIIE